MSHKNIPAELVERYNRNVQFLGKYLGDYINKPSKLSVALGIKDGHPIDLIVNGKSMYNMNAKKVCKNQVKRFLNTNVCMDVPVSRLLRFTHEKEFPLTGKAIANFAQRSPVYKDLMTLCNDEDNVYTRVCMGNNPAGVVIVFGVGLGYHIEELIKSMDINRLIVVEQDPALLKASFYCINWKEIVSNFQRRGKSIHLIFDTVNLQYELEKVLLFYVNRVVAANARFFQHYKLDLFDDLIKSFDTLRLSASSGLGNVDDELVGLKNTCGNCKNDVKVFVKPDVKSQLDVPVFIVGSGPSLNDSISCIKKFKDRALIVSCGTALSPLLKEGIVPDFHVEIERTEDQYRILKQVPSEYREKIHLLALNVVDPRVFGLFEKKTMFMKATDAGTYALDMVSNWFPMAGPTVTNGALSFFLHTFGKYIFLFGVDFGYRDSRHHHAKGSIYTDIDSFNKFEFGKDFEVKGNIGGKVFTNRIFMSAKVRMERLIYSVSRSRNIRVYNVGRGAFISGAVPVRVSDVGKLLNKELPVCHKHVAKEYIEKNRVSSGGLLENLRSNVLKLIDYMAKMEETLSEVETYISNMRSVNQIFEILEIEFEMFEKLFDKYGLSRILRGSFLHVDSRVIFHYFVSDKSIENVKKLLNLSVDAKRLLLEDVKQSLQNML